MSNLNPYRGSMDFGAYIMWAETYCRAHPSQRKGQAYYNALTESYPELIRHVSGTDHDPFYNDLRLPAFLTFVEEALKDS